MKCAPVSMSADYFIKYFEQEFSPERLEKQGRLHEMMFGKTIKNPDRRWGQFWKPKTVHIDPEPYTIEIFRGSERLATLE